MILRQSMPLVRALAVVAAATCLAACPQNPTLTRREIMNQSEYAPYTGKGSGVIRGEVVITTPDGRRNYGANGDVWLLPMVSETSRWMDQVVLPGKVKPPLFGAEAVRWTTTSDQAGRFEFVGLPAGDYYVASPVAWLEGGTAREAIAFAQVRLAPGQVMQVEVSRGTSR